VEGKTISSGSLQQEILNTSFYICMTNFKIVAHSITRFQNHFLFLGIDYGGTSICHQTLSVWENRISNPFCNMKYIPHSHGSTMPIISTHSMGLSGSTAESAQSPNSLIGVAI
jgi:hypothetical protein